jgi:hypothetical protein
MGRIAKRQSALRRLSARYERTFVAQSAFHVSQISLRVDCLQGEPQKPLPGRTWTSAATALIMRHMTRTFPVTGRSA